MLNSIRNFSKTIYAKIIIGLIIIPFVFWGMGSVFRSGNTNVVAKINDHKISTQDFMEHINNLNLDPEAIKENLENSILEEILADLVNTKLLKLEMKELNIKITDLNLLGILKKNKNFIDENNNFSRIKYEKYLLSNNISASSFEQKLRSSEERKIYFNYISGGTYSPDFLIKKNFNSQNKKVFILAINLEEIYKDKKEITDDEIFKFIDENKKNLKEKKISLSLSVLDPEILVSSQEFNQMYFNKIDEIDNEIINGSNFISIIDKFKLKKIEIDTLENLNQIKNVKLSKEIINLIKNSNEIDEIKLVDNGEEYILFNINNISETLPNKNSEKFKEKIKKLIIIQNKFDINQEILRKINTNTFKKKDFEQIANDNSIKIQKIKINNIKDDNFFLKESLQEIFKMPNKNYTISVNKNNEIHLVYIENIENFEIDKNNENYSRFFLETGVNLKNNIYFSYDDYLSKKYDLVINKKTLDRLKNYFR